MGYLYEPKPIKKKKVNTAKWLKKLKKRKKKKRIQKTPKYRVYIKSRAWRKRRAQYYRKHKKECWICHRTRTIGLHHLNYRNLGHEKDDDLVPLCWEHHGQLHKVAGHDTDAGMAYIDQERAAIEFYELNKTL